MILANHKNRTINLSENHWWETNGAAMCFYGTAGYCMKIEFATAAEAEKANKKLHDELNNSTMGYVTIIDLNKLESEDEYEMCGI